ncbi:MAG: hypothetical protein HQL32_05030 [Planctomycetes bacterium]|nr:hypothetical protein [Planctomycetota bacterium]
MTKKNVTNIPRMLQNGGMGGGGWSGFGCGGCCGCSGCASLEITICQDAILVFSRNTAEGA